MAIKVGRSDWPSDVILSEFRVVSIAYATYECPPPSIPHRVPTSNRILGVSDCASNCSSHGDCQYGYCSCHDGYYGLDCSNTSCPGDYCYYEETTRVQVCSHCCQVSTRARERESGSVVHVVCRLEQYYRVESQIRSPTWKMGTNVL